MRDAYHAGVAADAGADYFGLVFVEGVRRQLSLEQALDVLREYRDSHDGGPKIVGLFANQPASFVNRIVEACGLDLVQLCGDETMDYWRSLDVPVIRQVKVRDDGNPDAEVERVCRLVDAAVSTGNMVQLDKHDAGSLGGTGKAFDWGIAREVAKRYEVMLAGGLSPENVADAISVVHPWAVDVSSGVETGGVKDAARIAAFADAVRRAST
jgi:phosphoribosylanthranilate isomerase